MKAWKSARTLLKTVFVCINIIPRISIFFYLFQIQGFRCHAEVSHDPRQAVDHRWNILTFSICTDSDLYPFPPIPTRGTATTARF